MMIPPPAPLFNTSGRSDPASLGGVTTSSAPLPPQAATPASAHATSAKRTVRVMFLSLSAQAKDGLLPPPWKITPATESGQRVWRPITSLTTTVGRETRYPPHPRNKHQNEPPRPMYGQGKNT